ncbi:TIM barrel protein [Actinomadura sp. LD22]|uniref:TIM barrel protein n=1 Tax=Actinomadura physcomitrii TaxID=2650748 RepID=A0A6I4MT04_9ACTN|nr:sugar phosphate isomerase/epimerase family protein [Actinomadura physcomitrii]MWA06997.1 TIM barrel protein [Actinomadura physcomitrii]
MSALAGTGLIASHHTISGSPVNEPARHAFADRVAAAQAAGFTGIGLTVLDHDHLRESGASDRELRTIIDDHGIGVPEVEFLNGWWAEGERLAADRAAEDRIYAFAEAFGSRHLNVGASVPAGQEPPLDLLVERFAGICDRAAAHGLLVGLEYMPFFALSTVGRAWEVVRGAGRPNGGLVVDAWHHLRGPDGPEALRNVPGEKIVAIQLGDAPAESELPLLQESISARLWPGEGVLDVVGLLRVLDELGVSAPVGVEVVSTRVQELPVDKAAAEAARSAGAVLKEMSASRSAG